MSSSLSFPSMALLISLFALASLLASPTLSTSMDNTLETTGFTAKLSHVDHGKSLTKTELLRQGIQRGEMRQAAMAQLAATPPLSSQPPSQSIKASISGYNGEFYMNLTIGTPRRNYTVAVDTDTDLIWTKQCDSHSASYSKLPCSRDLCNPTGRCSKKGTCQYEYQYTSKNKVQVDLATETFKFGENVKTLGFSCGVHVKNGLGAVGLGRGPLSLISQMNASTFSYCLPSYDDAIKTGVVLVGSEIKTRAKMITTSLVTNKFFSSKYYINVTGISVGKVKLLIDPLTFTINPKDGTGGVVMDTGSTVTYLRQDIFEQVKSEVSNQIKGQLKVGMTSDYQTQLTVCFTIPPNSVKTFKYPIITFHLGGKVDLVLPIDNTYREYTEGNTNKTCLAMNPAPLSDRGMSSLGNIQQQNTLVVFDLHKETVAFLPNTECDKM